jgi:hypothetical protein
MICASNRSVLLMIHIEIQTQILNLKYRPWWPWGVDVLKLHLWVWISIWIISGTYLKHKSPIKINFLFLVLPYWQKNMEKQISHNSGPGFRIRIKVLRFLKPSIRCITNRGFPFKIFKFTPLGPTLAPTWIWQLCT